MSDFTDRRAAPSLKTNIPCTVQILEPEKTFSPREYEGSMLDISKVGIGAAISDMPQDVYSSLLRAKRFARIFVDLPGAKGQLRIFCKIVWLDYRSGDGGSLCCLGFSIEENPPEVLAQLDNALKVLAVE